MGRRTKRERKEYFKSAPKEREKFRDLISRVDPKTSISHVDPKTAMSLVDPKTVVNENLSEDSRYFERFKFDLETLKIECGLLSTSDLGRLQLSKDEMKKMLFSQLHISETLLKNLGEKLDTLISKGCELEKKNRYLKEKVRGLQDSRRKKYSNSSGKTEQSSDSDDSDSDNSGSHLFSKMEKENCESKPSAKCDTDSLANEEDTEVSWIKRLARNAALSDDKEAMKNRIEESNWIKSLTEDAKRGDSSSPAPGDEKAGTSSKNSITKDEDSDISDKIKAMVANAFKENSSKPEETPDHCSSSEEASRKDSVVGWKTEGDTSISEQVAAVAADSVDKSGYTFHEEFGLYYDHTSGYFYNAESALYYDPKTGTYFYYDHDSQEYKYHSQVPVEESADTTTQENVHATGDATSSYPQVSSSSIPPSLRLMVTESDADNVRVGTLHMVTINGGKVGRGPRNLVQLDDPCVSEEHAEFTYYSSSATDHHYYVRDLGSEVGTLINDVCICPPGEPSDEIEVGHGWELQFGTVKLKCHIHPGYLSCNDCEPGVVCAKLPTQSSQQDSITFGKNDEERRRILKAMRKKYAINPYEDPVFNMDKYEDKAKKRRKFKGSDNPYEKTEVASTETEIKSSNKGFALMQKMGWSKGESLGKSQAGITKPIETSSTLGRAGLGFGHAVAPPTEGQMKRKKILDVTFQRFNKL